MAANNQVEECNRETITFFVLSSRTDALVIGHPICQTHDGDGTGLVEGRQVVRGPVPKTPPPPPPRREIAMKVKTNVKAGIIAILIG
jgi:hypothetical protein